MFCFCAACKTAHSVALERVRTYEGTGKADNVTPPSVDWWGEVRGQARNGVPRCSTRLSYLDEAEKTVNDTIRTRLCGRLKYTRRTVPYVRFMVLSIRSSASLPWCPPLLINWSRGERLAMSSQVDRVDATLPRGRFVSFVFCLRARLCSNYIWRRRRDRRFLKASFREFPIMSRLVCHTCDGVTPSGFEPAERLQGGDRRMVNAQERESESLVRMFLTCASEH